MNSLDSRASTRKVFGQAAELRNALNPSSSMIYENEIRTCSCKAFRPEIALKKNEKICHFGINVFAFSTTLSFFFVSEISNCKRKAV